MWGRVRGFGTRSGRESAGRLFGGVLLSSLLLFLCTQARLARYETRKSAPTTASSRAYLDGEEIRKELSIVASVAAVFVVAFVLRVRIEAGRIRVAVLISPAFRGFVPDACYRPPPAA